MKRRRDDDFAPASALLVCLPPLKSLIPSLRSRRRYMILATVTARLHYLGDAAVTRRALPPAHYRIMPTIDIMDATRRDTIPEHTSIIFGAESPAHLIIPAFAH